MSKRPYIKEWLLDILEGKTPTEAGLTDEDTMKLLNCYERGGDRSEIHISVAALCACNICRS